MEEHLYSLLSGLGWPVAWGGLGQGTALPRIALFIISGTDVVTQDGRAGETSGRVQVDCYGSTYAEAVAVSRAVVDALSGYHGGPIKGAALQSIRDLPIEGGGDVIQRKSLDFAVTYRS